MNTFKNHSEVGFRSKKYFSEPGTWYIPVIPATQETYVKRISETSLGKKCETLSEK
jgi:hypothetical protein